MSLGFGSGKAMHPSTSAGLWEFGTAGDFSVAMMLKRVTTGTVAILLDKLLSTVGWRLRFNTANALNVHIGGTIHASVSSYIADTDPHVIVVVRDADTAIYGFLDGVKSTFSGGAPSGDATALTPLIVNARNTGTAYANYADGERSNFAIWDRALTDNEAYMISGLKLAPQYFHPTDYWTMEFTSDNADDVAVNNDTGLLNIGSASGGVFGPSANHLVVDTLYGATAGQWSRTPGMHAQWTDTA